MASASRRPSRCSARRSSAPAQLGAAGVEAGEALGQRHRGVAVGGGVGGGGVGAEAVDAGEAAEGPELADDLGEDDEGEQGGQRQRDAAEQSGSAASSEVR